MIDPKKRKKPSKIELTIELIVISDEERWNKRPWSAQTLVNGEQVYTADSERRLRPINHNW